MPEPGILAGLRVVELSAFVAAPLAGATLASLGANVIRVEQSGGGIDAGRWPIYEQRSLYRAGLDRGKRSLAIDLRSPRGQQLVAELVCGGGDGGGILVTNLPSRGVLAFDQLVKQRPDVIVVQITGSADGRAAVDYTVNAGIGFPWVTGPEGWVGPVNHVLPAWDVTAAMLAATAVLAAERHRRLTGEGQLVELALSDVALAIAGHLGYLDEARLMEEPRGRYGNDLYGSYGRDFRTRDERHIMVCALTRRQWTSLVHATGLAAAVEGLEAVHGLSLHEEGERFRHRHEIHALLEPWFAARTLDEVRDAFDSQDVLWSPYRTFQELVREEPAAADPYASPINFSRYARPRAPRAPAIGADTEQLLAEELGLEPSQVARLRAEGVVD